MKQEIGKYFELKPESIGPHSLYLGGRLHEVVLESGEKAWAFGSSQYVQAAVKNIEEYLEQIGESLKPKEIDVLPKGCCPEIDILPKLGTEDASHFQSLIGVLRQMVELERVNMCTEVSMMSSCLAMPRRGHLDALFRVFAYLKKNHNTCMVFNPTEPKVDMKDFPREDWSYSIYGDAKEELPPMKPFDDSGPGDMTKPRGIGFTNLGLDLLCSSTEHTSIGLARSRS